MLTRCKAGMVIVTNRVFLRTTSAQYTLLGRLAQYWAKRHGESNTWTDWKDVAELKANMPGVLGPRRVVPSPSTNATIAAPTSRASKSQAPVGLRLPVSQLQGTGQKLPTSSHAKDDFPALGSNGGSKPVAQGRWNSPAGLRAIKRVTATPVSSSGAHSLSSGYFDQPGDSPRGPERQTHDHFPALGDHQAKRVRGKRKK